MNSERWRRIEQRAYALWEAEGQPHGKDEEHWHRATREVDTEESASAVGKRASRRAAMRDPLNSGNRAARRNKARA